MPIFTFALQCSDETAGQKKKIKDINEEAQKI